ncbi:MAG: MoaD/ThiS family protein [Alphaproteobacteria bacterium]
MARVILSGDLARRFAGGDTELEVPGETVRRLIAVLDERYPGIGEVLSGHDMAVAIDGIIHQDGLYEPVPEDAEVFFMPAIRGG